MDKEDIYNVLNEAYFSDQPHEKDILMQLAPHLQDVKIFVDVGASLGQYTLFANQQMRQGKIIAIEADPVRVDKLRENSQNWMSNSSNQIEVIHAAACDHEGTTTFHTSHSNTSGGITKPQVETDQAAWEAIRVPAITLDKLFTTPPDFIKVDIEGGELDLVKGATKLLQTGKTNFFIELHHWADPLAVIRFMRSYSYYPQYIVTGNHCLFIHRRGWAALWFRIRAKLKQWL